MTVKVCHITSAHKSNDNRIFQKECVSIAKDKHFDVYLVAPGESREERSVKVIGVGEKPAGRLKRMLFFSKHVYNVAVKVDADIYHFHDPELLSAGLKLKKLGKKVVFDSHENTVEQIRIKEYLPKMLRNLIANVFYTWETHVCKMIDAVIFPCLVNGKNPFEGRCKETIFINNYPYLSEFLNVEKKEPEYDICVIGSLTPERGITQLLEACKAVGAKIALAGEFSPAGYEAELREKGLLDCAVYLGNCNRQQVVDIYSKTKIGASTILPVGQYPSIDNLPTKVYECMATGLPVIISDFNYPKSVMKDFEFGICVDCEDIDQLSSAIKLLMNNSELRTQMGEEGKRAITDVFNWEMEAEKIIQLYLRLKS